MALRIAHPLEQFAVSALARQWPRFRRCRTCSPYAPGARPGGAAVRALSITARNPLRCRRRRTCRLQWPPLQPDAPASPAGWSPEKRRGILSRSWVREEEALRRQHLLGAIRMCEAVAPRTMERRDLLSLPNSCWRRRHPGPQERGPGLRCSRQSTHAHHSSGCGIRR